MPRGLVADVRVRAQLDGVAVIPRDMSRLLELHGSVHDLIPGPGVRRAPGALFVAPFRAPALRRSAAQGLDLRWSEEAVRFSENRARVLEVHDRVLGRVRAATDAGREGALRELASQPHLAGLLDDHQLVNVAAMTVPESVGLCVFDEQGTGKTVTMIFAFDRLVAQGRAERLIIVAPKSMVPEWPHDIERFTGGLYTVEMAIGDSREKRSAIRTAPDVLVTNFETAVSMERELTALLRPRPDQTVLAVDESFFIKNLDARRTQAVRRLREWCGHAYVLCGTPAPNSPADLVQQVSIVDFGMTFDGVNVPDDRVSAAPVIKQALDDRAIYVRHRKEDVLPALPARRFSRVVVSLSPEQRVAYDAVLNDLIADLRQTSEMEFKKRLVSFLARRTALLQLCSHPGAVLEEYSEVPAKLRALDELLAMLVDDHGNKVVVWSFYTASIDAIMERFQQYSPVRYDGRVPEVAARRDAVSAFQKDNETMLMVANPAAAGAGLTLHRANVAIYESLSNQAAHYLQSLDRIHRRGQERTVEYLMLLCDDTIEMAEFDRLLAKDEMARDLLGDPRAQSWTRNQMLDELHDLAAPGVPRPEEATSET